MHNILPKLSIVIPSYNQGQFIEETILSIINQNYSNLELIIIDGGSSDNSVDIIKKYESYISFWVSEKDRGQSHAINKGIEKATGEWIAWMNSDDCYLPGAFDYIKSYLINMELDFLFGDCSVGLTIGNASEHKHNPKYKRDLYQILNFFYDVKHIIPSQSVFVRKTVVDRVGLLNENLHYCMDLDWFARIYLKTESRLFYSKTICFFRIHDVSKSSTSYFKMTNEAMDLASQYKEYLEPVLKWKLQRLIKYYKAVLLYQNSKANSFKDILLLGCKYFPIPLFHVKYRMLLKRALR